MECEIEGGSYPSVTRKASDPSPGGDRRRNEKSGIQRTFLRSPCRGLFDRAQSLPQPFPQRGASTQTFDRSSLCEGVFLLHSSTMQRRTGVLACVMLLSLVAAMARGEGASAFKLTLDGEQQKTPYSGRVYVAFGSAEGKGEPRRTMDDWFRPGQVLSLDVKDVAPGGSVTIDAKNARLAFPKAFVEITAGKWRVQGIARRNLDSCKPGRGEGDLYSEVAEIEFDPSASGVVELKLSKAAMARKPQENERTKYVDMKSEKLSAFSKREVMVHCGVYLPKEWSEEAVKSGKTWATLWFIGGFGGDHTIAGSLGRSLGGMPGGENVIIVCPDATCYRGHSVFADSANNGPWGAMLMDEMVPTIEKQFGGAGVSKRYVTGMSSGGWSSLWLQVTYPEAWAGLWSFCPDPVDFRDFQQINLDEPGANMYKDKDGKRRGLARGREDDEPGIYYDEFVRQETVMGPGGQIHSFEAVFSPRGADGEPMPLFDRATGNVDAKVAKAWEPYDIRMVIEKNWATLGPKLKGKMNIIAGGRDTFYLEGAAKLLKESLEKLGSDAKVEIVPGMPHSMYPPAMQKMMRVVGGLPEMPAGEEEKK